MVTVLSTANTTRTGVLIVAIFLDFTSVQYFFLLITLETSSVRHQFYFKIVGDVLNILCNCSTCL